MFGMQALYVGEKIMLVVRQRKNQPELMGLGCYFTWQLTSLKKEFPSFQHISSLYSVNKEPKWQMIYENDIEFEEMVIRICGLIKQKDLRIGRTPKSKT